MKKKNNIQKITIPKIYIIISCVILFSGAFVIYRNTNSNSHIENTYLSNQNEQISPFIAKYLKFKALVPSKYTVEEKYNDINLTYSGKMIRITRFGSNYDNVSDFFENLNTKSSFNVLNKEELKNQYYKILKVKMAEHIYSDGSKANAELVYYILNNYWVYSFSTSSPELENDLDAIVRSFKVLP